MSVSPLAQNGSVAKTAPPSGGTLGGALGTGRQVTVTLAAQSDALASVHLPALSLGRLAQGRTVDAAADMAGMLFGVCPKAHQVAFMEAAEQALGLAVSRETFLARRHLVLAEALTQCVWRHALTWRALVNEAPDVVALKQARSLMKEIDQKVSQGGSLTVALAQLADVVKQQIMATTALCQVIPDYEIVHRFAPLSDQTIKSDGFDSVIREETPLALFETAALFEEAAGPTTLDAWFAAHVRLATELATALDTASLEHVMDAQSWSTPGVVMTARGRLVHQVTLDADGLIQAWHYKAPTDWNCAAGGPVAATLAGVHDVDLARWIVAAFDPCVPIVFIGGQVQKDVAHA